MAGRRPRGLILTGGGARAAYQAGVLHRIRELSREPSGKVPFEVLVGVSAGAINLAGLAANAPDFEKGVAVLLGKWKDISTDQVFETRTTWLLGNMLSWLFDLTLGGILRRREPRGRSLVDTSPLARLLSDVLPQGAVSRHIQNGWIDAVAVSATDYTSKALTVFVEASTRRTLWRRYSRLARYDQIGVQHVLASCALPILFPAVRIGNAYYGDGSIRNLAPLSPAIHLGARRLVAVGVREPHSPSRIEEPSPVEPAYPSPAAVGGVLLDSVFLDALETDREQMLRINGLLEELPEGSRDGRQVRLARTDLLYLGPSEDLASIALRHRGELPRMVRYLMGGLGSGAQSGGELLSYLLFEPGYCRELLELGYRDAVQRSDEIGEFLWGAAQGPAQE